MKCSLCHRELKNEESIKRGMGETCAKRAGIIVANVRLRKNLNNINNSYKQQFLFDINFSEEN